MAKKTKPGYKRCSKCNLLVKGPRTKTCPKCQHAFAMKVPAVPKSAAVAVEPAPAKTANAVTLEQIKMVGQTVNTIGGFRRLHEMLAVIKEVGGLKKFKDLLDAMAVSEGGDGIPF